MGDKRPAKKVKPTSSWMNSSFMLSEDIENETSDSDIEIVDVRSDITGVNHRTSSTASRNHALGHGLIPTMNFTEPIKREDLAVNKKKVDDVDSWMSEAFGNNFTKPMILLLTGPTGAGKTATVHALANSKNIQVVEWTNPMDDFYENDEHHHGFSQASKFEDFLIASARYNCIIGPQNSTKLIIVEDYPNALILKPELFHDILRKYQFMGKSPVVFITTDVHCGKNISLSLFPHQITSELRIQHIGFNAIAPTSLAKALVHALKTKNRQDVPTEMIQAICQACNGDIRNAMLELLYLTQEGYSSTKRNTLSRPVKLPVRRKRKAEPTTRKSPLDADKKPSTLRGKDFLSGIMHSIGRVLHAKRVPNIISGGSVDSDKRGYLKSNPQEIVNEFLSQYNHFVSLAQENYHSIFSDIHSASQATKHLCDADIIMSEWKEKDLLKEIGFSIAVRGIMNACNNPIQRWKPLQKSKWKEIMVETDQYLRNLQCSSSLISFSTRALCMDFAPLDGSNVRSNPYCGAVHLKTIDSKPVSPLPHITDDDSD